MDFLCHLKNSELKQKFQKKREFVVLRGDAVKNVSGAYVVFTEQGSITHDGREIVDVFPRLPRCEEQASDVVSAHTPRLPKSERKTQQH